MPRVTIINTTNGAKQQMDSSFRWEAIQIIKEVNRIPTAELLLADSKHGAENFYISNSGFFDPGQSIEIKLRHTGSTEKEKTVFKGVVVRHHIKGGANGSMLTVELKDPAFKLTTSRKSAVYLDKTDTEIIEEIIKEAISDEQKNGINPPAIQQPNVEVNTNYKHKEIPRYYCTDWDFMLSRADINGLLTMSDNGKITIAEMPDLNQKETHTFELGISPSIFDFEMETNVRQQYNTIQSTAWDIKQQELILPKDAKDFTIKQAKDINKASTYNAVGGYSYGLMQFGEATDEEMQAWADAKMAKSRMAMANGRIKARGNADYNVGEIIKIARVSKMFNAKTMISGIRHTAGKKGWQTDVLFGLSPDWFSQNEDIVDTPAAGLLPAVNGLQIAVVDQFEENDQYRVKVRVPVISDQPIWARLATTDAGKERGTFFRPEPGDEVIIGFFNDDPRQPVILGSLYSTDKHKIPEDFKIDKDNLTKGMVTKNGVKLHINEKENECTVTIETPEGNSVVLKDGEGITLTDEHKNSIQMNSDGINIKTDQNLTVEASNMTVDK